MIRRLPYALRACTAALQQVSITLEECAESIGATKRRTIQKIVVPLMTGGILAGFVIVLQQPLLSCPQLLCWSLNSDAPLAYGIYLFMQTPSGQGFSWNCCCSCRNWHSSESINSKAIKINSSNDIGYRKNRMNTKNGITIKNVHLSFGSTA